MLSIGISIWQSIFNPRSRGGGGGGAGAGSTFYILGF